MPSSSSWRLASSSAIASRLSTAVCAVSFSSAACSISSWMIRRCTWSISIGIESISILSRDAASSTRSIALSGRNRSEMYRSDSIAAATIASSEMRTPWCTS